MKDNFGFQEELVEISKRVNYKKGMAEHMSRMSDLKLNLMINQ